MLNNVCNKIVKYYVLKGKIKHEDIVMYEYCFEVLLSTVINLIILLAIGFGTGNYVGTIIFSIVFMLLRGAYGGYHAKTHVGCSLVLLVTFTSLIVTIEFVEKMVLSYLGIVFLVLSLLIFIIIGPVDNENKRMSGEEKRRKRLLGLVMISILMGVYIPLVWFSLTLTYGYCIAFTMAAVALSLIIGKVKDIIKAKQCCKLKVKEYEM